MTEREKNNYQRTEAWLYKLNALKQRIKNLEKMYQEEESRSEGDSIDYSKDKLCQTYKFNSQTENIAMSLAQIHMTKETLVSRINMLEDSMMILNDIEREVIKLKYFDNEPWFNIAYKVQYSERQARNIRTNAVKKLAAALFGEVE